MRPILKGASSPDAADLEKFSGPEAAPWAIYVELSVGPDAQDGEETFGITICSPRWIEQQVQNGPRILRHHIVVAQYSWAAVRQFIVSYLSAIEGDTWGDVAGHVARLAQWEFEDYRP
jgi:hypothetical protein